MTDTVMDDNRRVLVIDDNTAIHEDFKKIFAYDDSNDALREMESLCFGEEVESTPKLNVEIDTASQGEEGRDKIAAALSRGTPYAMAFVDMRMPPGWDGLRTIEEIWKVDPALQVVICSAYSDNTWEDIYNRLGKTDQLLILKKPFDNTEVSQLALALTEKWNLARQANMKQEELEQIVEERTIEIKRKDDALRQKQKLESVGSLAAGVAHQFNNSLQIVLGYLQFALDEIDPMTQISKDLHEARNAAQKSAEVVEQLLIFGKSKATMKRTCSLPEIIFSVEKVIEASLGKEIVYSVQVDGDCGSIFADSDAIIEALLNLCLNARDAMPEGGSLTVRTYLTSLGKDGDDFGSAKSPNLLPGEYSVIEVSDTGCGMSPNTMERIFDPFFTTKDVDEGSGMGLSVVFGTLSDHDGTVTVESEKGKGSTFRAFFPTIDNIATIAHPADDEHDEIAFAGAEDGDIDFGDLLS